MKQALMLLLAVGLAVVSAPQAFAATIETDTTYYAPGDTVAITGTGYSAFETITIEVTSILGLGPEDTWDVTADATGTVETSYYLSAELDVPDTMAIGVSSETPQDLSGTSVVLGLKTYLHQLHNGTSTASPGWALGNINSSNSCYSESRSVPFRYFVKGTLGDSEHFFTIQCEWTKNGLHAYDYFTDVDLSEADAIFDAGGLCGTDFADPPPGCITPTGSFAFPDPTNTSNYSGSLPGDFFPSGFVLDEPRNMKFFN
ncbi:MAG: hypothetical protein KAT85_07975, partial [candidate division Zixibacteria bacterium]|nr:hypothetical protein [candidate division Zixibacteria bacterium]